MRVAIYCRLSEEDKDKGTSEESMSIQNQKSMLSQYALERNWEIVQIYSDEDYSGADRFRPAFCRMIKDCEDGKIDIVLCKTQSRFSREIEVVEKYLHTLFPAWGVRFISIVDCADTEKLENKKARQINGLINEWYLEDLSKNIRSVLTSRRIAGLHIGSFALYGYTKDILNKGHIIPDPAAAVVVQRVFSLYCNGYGKSTIARIFNQEGIPSPSEYKRLSGMKYQNKALASLWRYSTIDAMLKNQMYIGNMVQGKYASISYKSRKVMSVEKSKWIIAENTHEPIIDKKTWDKTQMLLSEKTRSCVKGEKSLFSGILKCAYCNCSMRKSVSRGNVYYRCPTHYISKDTCIGSFISENSLAAAITKRIIIQCDKYYDEERITEKLSETPAFFAHNAALSLEKKKETLMLAIKALYSDFVCNNISKEDFTFLRNSYKHDIDKLNTLIMQSATSVSLNATTANKEFFENLLQNKSRNFQIFHSFIEKILVGKRKNGENEIPVEIYWSF